MACVSPLKTISWLLVALLVCIYPAAGRAIKDIHVVALFKDRVMVMIDGKQRLLRSGDSSPEGVRLVSADSVGAVFEYQGRTLERRPDLLEGRAMTPEEEQLLAEYLRERNVSTDG